jgi:transposase
LDPAQEATVAIAGTPEGKRPRRSWSSEEKRRIVEEACRPGASVADIARHHGLNANQVFNWRKTALAASAAAPAEPLSTTAPSRLTGPAAFIPIGVFGLDEDKGPGLVAGSSSTVSPASSDRAGLPRPAMDERPGIIEIDLADGTRLRVDAFVNERSLRRVLAVLRSVS